MRGVDVHIQDKRKKGIGSLLYQRVAPQFEHFAVPPGRALPQFAQNFLIAGATSVGCEPIDWDPVEYEPILYCPDFSSCESAPSTATLTMVASSPMPAMKRM